MRKILINAVMALITASSVSIQAAPAYSWNLSRDMINGMATNPFGSGSVWAAMYDATGTSHNENNYYLLPVHLAVWYGYPLDVWAYAAASVPLIGAATSAVNMSGAIHPKGVPMVHPATTRSAVIRWKSPISGNVTISGIIADRHSACGDGVMWYVDKGNFTLMSGEIANDTNYSTILNGTTVLQQNIPVSVGTNLYFIVSAKNNDSCDSTTVDITISSS